MHPRRLGVSALAACWCVLAAAPSRAAAQIGPGPDTGSVFVTTGSGEVRLPPDRAVIRLAVETRAASAAAAASQNGRRLRGLVDSLTAVRLPDESVQVVGVAVRPNENFQQGTLVDYEASAAVRVTIRNLDRLTRILDVALSSGATALQDVEFESNRAAEAKTEALARAYDAARRHAEALARAANVALGPLLRVSMEPQYEFEGAGVARAAYISVTGGVPIAPSEIVVSAGVQATWRIGPRSR